MIYHPDPELVQEALCGGCPLILTKYSPESPPDEECPLDFVPELLWLDQQEGLACDLRWRGGER